MWSGEVREEELLTGRLWWERLVRNLSRVEMNEVGPW